jgi:hypothetical protein
MPSVPPVDSSVSTLPFSPPSCPFNAALNGSSLEDANRMENRNQSLIIANAITEGMKELG